MVTETFSLTCFNFVAMALISYTVSKFYFSANGVEKVLPCVG